MKTKRVIKIIFAFFLTLIAVQFLNKNVFIANSPQIRPDVGSAITFAFSGALDSITLPLAKLFNSSQSVQQKLANIPLQKISTGVYAKQSGNTGYFEFKGDEITWREYTVVVNGKTVVVKVPNGTNPPSQADLEKFYK